MWSTVVPLLLSLLVSDPMAQLGAGNLNYYVRRKRDNPGDINEFVKEEVGKLSDDSFDGDVLLLQRIDTVAHVSNYFLATDNSSLIFERHVNDRDPMAQLGAGNLNYYVRRKRDNPGDINEFVKEEVGKLSDDSFDGDVLLLQRIDTVAHVSNYFLATDNSSLIFERHVNDRDPMAQLGAGNLNYYVRRKRDNPGDINEFVKEEVGKLSDDSFDGDVLLLQRIDTVAHVSNYFLATDNSSLIFERHVNDRGTDVIVLSAEEDKLIVSGAMKRRYVVLREYQGGPLYHVVYAYLRDFNPVYDRGAPTTEDANSGGRYVIEWDAWDYRGPGQERFVTYGFTNCGPSAIVPCGYNPIFSPDSDLKPSGVKERWVPTSETARKNPAGKNNLVRIRGEDGYDIGDTYDFYSDLEPQSSRDQGTKHPLPPKQKHQVLLDQDTKYTNVDQNFKNRPKIVDNSEPSQDSEGSKNPPDTESRPAPVPLWAGGPSGYFYESASTAAVSSSLSSTSTLSGSPSGPWISSRQSKGDSVGHASGQKLEVWTSPDGSGAVRRSGVEASEIGRETGAGLTWQDKSSGLRAVSFQNVEKNRVENRTEGGGRWGPRVKRSVTIREQEDDEHEEEGSKIRYGSRSSKMLETSRKDKDQILSDAMGLMSFTSGGDDLDDDDEADIAMRESARREKTKYRESSSKSRIREDDEYLRDREYRRDRDRKRTEWDRDRDDAKRGSKSDKLYQDRDKSYRSNKDRDSIYRGRDRDDDRLIKERDQARLTGTGQDKDSLYVYSRDKETQIYDRETDKVSLERAGRYKMSQDRDKDTVLTGRETEVVLLKNSQKDDALLYRGKETEASYKNQDREKVFVDRAGGDKLSQERGKDSAYVGKEREAALYYGGKEPSLSTDKDSLYIDRNRGRTLLKTPTGEKLTRDGSKDTIISGRERDSLSTGDLVSSTKEKDVLYRNQDRENIALENPGGDRLTQEREKDTAYVGKERGASLYYGGKEPSLYTVSDKDSLYIDRNRDRIALETPQGQKLTREGSKDNIISERERGSLSIGDSISSAKEKDILYRNQERENVALENPGGIKLSQERDKDTAYVGKERDSALYYRGKEPTLHPDSDKDSVYIDQNRGQIPLGEKLTRDGSKDTIIPGRDRDSLSIGDPISSTKEKDVLYRNRDRENVALENPGGVKLTQERDKTTLLQDREKDSLNIDRDSTLTRAKEKDTLIIDQNREKISLYENNPSRDNKILSQDKSSDTLYIGRDRESLSSSPNQVDQAKERERLYLQNQRESLIYRDRGIPEEIVAPKKSPPPFIESTHTDTSLSLVQHTDTVRSGPSPYQSPPQGNPRIKQVPYPPDQDKPPKIEPPGDEEDSQRYNIRTKNRGGGEFSDDNDGRSKVKEPLTPQVDLDERTVAANHAYKNRKIADEDVTKPLPIDDRGHDATWSSKNNNPPNAGNDWGEEISPPVKKPPALPQNNLNNNDWSNVEPQKKTRPENNNNWSHDEWGNNNQPKNKIIPTSRPETWGDNGNNRPPQKSPDWEDTAQKNSRNSNDETNNNGRQPETIVNSHNWNKYWPSDRPSKNNNGKTNKNKEIIDYYSSPSPPHSSFFQENGVQNNKKRPEAMGRGIVKSPKRPDDNPDDNPTPVIFRPAHLTGKGDITANAASTDGQARANAVDKIGLGAKSTAINGSSATANSLSTTSGDALSRSETYGAGGSKSNALAQGTGVAIGRAISRGRGDSEANSISRANGAEANSFSGQGGNSKANSISNNQGDSIASSVALRGGNSRSSALSHGAGTASSASLTEGGGASYSSANARGGGSALSSSASKDGGASHSSASSVAGGSSFSTSVSKGGGRTVADAMAEQGESVATAVSDSGEDDTPFDPDTFADHVKTMPDATFTVVNPTLGRSIVPQDSESSSSSPQNMENQVYLPGWKTQYLSQPIQPNATLKHDSDLFFGLGSCPYKSADESDLEDNNGERFLRYYMTLLRSWCLPKEVKMMKRLIKDGALVVSGTILKVNEAYLRRGKLSPTQLEDVSIAFEMHLFSQMVNDARSSSVVSRAPAGKRVSRSVRFLEDLIIKGVQEARSLTRRHFIHLTRQLILVAKVTYTKLLQDFDVIEPCDRCVFDKRLNLNDRMEVMALIQWLLKGMGPLNKAGADSVSAEDSFTNFFNINNAAIEARVQNYAD